MELLCVLAAVAALFCGCAVLTLKCRVPASVAPLTALSAIVAVLTLAAMAGVLYPAAWLLYLLCLAGGVWVAASCRGSTGAAQRLFTPGSVLFWGMALAFTVYFFVRQPMATDFDELSLWATAVKITKVNDSLYATAELGTPWAATQNPGLPLLAYFFQFFGDYADWKIYIGYDILYFSVFAAVVGAIPREKWRVAVPMAAVLWCVPFFFTNYNHTIYLTTTYMTSYGDVPAGLVFGGAVAAWLALRQNSAPKWAVLPILALSANIKANTAILRTHADGRVWVHTGDIGYLDEDGFVYLDSRIKRLIIRHDGFKVFPSMIENVVSQHPAVHQCSVVGCVDKDHVQGRLPFVYLVLDPAVPAAKRKQIIKELRQLCIEELPEYVQPVGYKIIPEMPLTLAAKFDYRKLEEEITPRDY